MHKRTVEPTLESGLKANNTASDKKSTPMAHVTKVGFSLAKRMVSGISTGVTVLLLWEIFSTIKFTVAAITNGAMAGSIQESGKKTKCMALGNLSGQMVECTLVLTSADCDTDLVSFNGRTTLVIKVIGATVISMVAELLYLKTVHHGTDCGKKVIVNE